MAHSLVVSGIAAKCKGRLPYWYGMDTFPVHRSMGLGMSLRELRASSTLFGATKRSTI